ncbi:hypothetical protein [Marinithermofilum abyssi]|uniref:hypothetical protein n=1 Tax=Marinithermofilum abyssi TaxID=1571185 RepID=UPI0016680CDE|nr:hypothetical protein [Marinithermofilum abyssi]
MVKAISAGVPFSSFLIPPSGGKTQFLHTYDAVGLTHDIKTTPFGKMGVVWRLVISTDHLTAGQLLLSDRDQRFGNFST